MSEIEVITSGLWLDTPLWFKGYVNMSRSPGAVTAWVIHQTAVAGGFGVSQKAVERHGGDRWAALLERFEGSEHYLDEDAWAGQPYHYIWRPQERRLVVLHHPRLCTWHGHASNDYSLGFAIDGKFPGDQLNAAALAAAFEAASVHAASLGYMPGELEAHRQHHSSRGGDPGEQVWPVVESTARPLGIIPTLTRTTGSGRPIPDLWRPELPPTAETAAVMMPVFVPVKGRKSSALELVQWRLARAGHNPGPVDGLWGPNTREALHAFKAAKGTGGGDIIDGSTWAALLASE